jgi:hypothetical protein
MIPPSQPYYGDEISISELLMKLWVKRGLIVMLPLVLAGLTIAGLLLGKTSQQTVLNYYIELNGITLSSAAGDSDSDSDSDRTITTRYPNGIVFSPQDLMNPSVLQVLAKQYSIGVDQIAKDVSVHFGTPLSQGVLIEYEAALSASSKASAETLAAINERYQKKLAAAAKRGLKISVDYVALELSKEQGQGLAVDLASAWNTVFTTQFKTQISPEAISQRVPLYMLDVTSTVGFLTAENQLKQVQKGAEALAKDGRLAALTTQSGTTAADLLGYLEDFRTIYFDLLYVNAFAQDSSLSELYRRDTQLQIAALSEDITELNSRLTDIQQFQRGALGTSSSSRDMNTNAQYDGSALTEVVSLAERAALSGYFEETLDIRRELITARSSLQTKLRRIENASDLKNTAISDDFSQVAVSQYKDVVAAYGALIEAARSMLIAETPSYFSPITQPNTSGRLLEKRDFLFIALALALGGMLAVIAALIWPQKS